MRQITRTRGKHIGVHYIFDGYTEAVKYLADELSYLNTNNHDLSDLKCFKHWLSSLVRDNDWITTDNGVVIQVLKIYRMKEPKYGKYEIVCIKTVGVMGYYVHYLVGDKAGLRISRGNLNVTEQTISENRLKQTMSPTNNRGGVKKVWKRLFVYYLVIYTSPVLAYQLMMKQKDKYSRIKLSYSFMQKEAYELLKDPFVVKELESYMSVETFRERLSKKLAENGIDEEKIAAELVKGLDKVVKGSQTHKQFIEMMVNILRFTDEKQQIGPDGKPLSKIEGDTVTDDTYLPAPPKQLESIVDEATYVIVEKQNNMVLDNVKKSLLDNKNE